MRWLIVAVALVSPAAAAILYFVEPTDGSWYPKCFLHWTTGLHCPFCGSTRTCYALVHGDLAQAAAWNVLAVALVPVALCWLYWAAMCAVRGKPLPPTSPPNWLLRAFLIVLLVFWIARNLPFFPFDQLAPHRL